MKTLLVINGTMGVGKTTVSMLLQQRLTPSIFLDGDWCWFMNPWHANDLNKTMVEDNIVHLLNSFLNNPQFDWIIFSWILHKERIWQGLAQRLDLDQCHIKRFTLTCNPEALEKRMVNDHRTTDVITRSLTRLDQYLDQQTIKIDTTDCTPEEVVNLICSHLAID